MRDFLYILADWLLTLPSRVCTLSKNTPKLGIYEKWNQKKNPGPTAYKFTVY